MGPVCTPTLPSDRWRQALTGTSKQSGQTDEVPLSDEGEHLLIALHNKNYTETSFHFLFTCSMTTVSCLNVSIYYSQFKPPTMQLFYRCEGLDKLNKKMCILVFHT